MAARVPAIDSNDAVPVSNRSWAGRTLKAGSRSKTSRLAVQRAEVRPEPLVGTAHEEVRVERADVDRAVWRVGDGIDVGECTDLVSPRDDLRRPD